MEYEKGLLPLKGVFEDEQFDKLNAGAQLHKRHSNIEFKVLYVSGTDLTIRTTQGKSLAENYADTATLVKRTKELFGKFYINGEIHVHPVPYSPPVIDIVTPEWISKNMLKYSVRSKDIIAVTGIDKTNLSAWIKGTRPMSQPVKGLFYFYFVNESHKGKSVFSIDEYKMIYDLISQLETVSEESLKKRIREKLRNDYEFYISKFTPSKTGFTLDDFTKLVDDEIIKIIK